jgi:hypothetical protein
MIIDATRIKTTYIKGRKAYFVSDIAEVFGKAPVAKLVKHKAIFTERVKAGGKTRVRRLVSHKALELVNALVEAEEAVEGLQDTAIGLETAQANAQPAPAQIDLAQIKFVQPELLNDYKPIEDINRVEVPEISLAAIKDKQLDLEQVRNSMIQKRINDLCFRQARETIKTRGLTKDQALGNDREVYREPYLIMYTAFDRYMRAELVKFNMTLEDIGLGYAKNVNNRSYIDRIAEVGQLNNLLVVAEALFQPKN